MRRLVLDFPLRPNFVAQIVVPSDMTTEEAARFRGFVQSLALPGPPPNRVIRESDPRCGMTPEQWEQFDLRR